VQGREGRGKICKRQQKKLRDRRMRSEEMGNRLVGCNREGLREEVSQVDSTREMGDSELKLRNPIPNPMESHVNRLAHLSGNGTVG
jgi:hypothetical protein